MTTQPGLLILIGAKPWSEWPEGTPAETVARRWEQQGAYLAAGWLQGDQYTEFVTARTQKVGVDPLIKPKHAVRPDAAPHEPSKGGEIVKLTLRPVHLPAGTLESLELLKGLQGTNPSNPSGGAAVLLPHFNFQDFPHASPLAVRRQDSNKLHQLFSSADDAERVARAIDRAVNAGKAACHHQPEPNGAKRKQNKAVPHPVWIRQAGYMAWRCRTPKTTPEDNRSTRCNVKRRRFEARPNNSENLQNMGCTCQDLKFAELLAQNCPVGILRVVRHTTMTEATALHLFRHDAKITLLTFLRTTDIHKEDIFKGCITPDSPEVFRAATGLPGSEGNNCPRSKDHTGAKDGFHSDKHRAAFVISCKDLAKLQDANQHRATTTTNQTLDACWQHGALLLLTAAPRSSGGRWRMIFGSRSPIHGEVIVVMLPWIGSALFHHEALRQAWSKQQGGADSLRTLIRCMGRPNPIPGIAIPHHFLRGKMFDLLAIAEHELRANVSLDKDQMQALACLHYAETPLVAIKALAGTGKSMVGAIMVHAVQRAQEHAQPPPERPQIVLWIVPTRALRDEVVGRFQQGGMLEPEQVHWLGRPTDTNPGQKDAEEILMERVYADQAAARANLASLQQHLKEALDTCLEADANSPSFWNNLAIAKEHAAKYMTSEVSGIVRTMDKLLQKHVQKLRLVILTADAAAKLFAGLHPGIMGKLLRYFCEIVLGIIDEAQRAEVIGGAALLAHLPSTVVMMDPNQQWFVKSPNWALQPWTDQLEHECQDKAHGGFGPGPASTAPATESPHQENPRKISFSDLMEQECGVLSLSMSLTHRFGQVVCRYLAALFPRFLQDLQAASNAPNTLLLHVWYTPSWRSPASGSPLNKACVAWESTLFRAIGAKALQQLMDLERRFEDRTFLDGVWDDKALLVLVAGYLHRVVGPLGWFFQKLISEARSIRLLRHTQVSNIQVRVLDTLCGPTSEHTHVLLHRRTKGEPDMHKGIQNCEKRYYVAVSRARQSTTIWLDALPFGKPGRWLNPNVSHGLVSAKMFHKRILETVQQQQLPWEELEPGRDWDHDCRLPWWISEGFTEEGGARSRALSALHVAEQSRHKLPPQESKQPTYRNLVEALTANDVQRLAQTSLQASRRTGIDQALAPHRHDLRPAAEQVSDVWPSLAAKGFELGHILVDGMVAKQWGKGGLQLSIPCLYLDKGQAWPRLGSSHVAEGEPMVRALVALAWAVLSLTSEATAMRLISKSHKAEVVNIAGCTWWSRQCHTDREATLLVTTTTAGPKGTHMYAYLGGGSLSAHSSDLLQCIVVRTRNWQSGAAVMAATSGTHSFMLTCRLTQAPKHRYMFRAPLALMTATESPCRAARTSLTSPAPPSGRSEPLGSELPLPASSGLPRSPFLPLQPRVRASRSSGNQPRPAGRRRNRFGSLPHDLS